VLLVSFKSCPPPVLPTWQDCHELWSKKRRRQMREQQEQQQRQQPATNLALVGNGREKDSVVSIQEESSEPALSGG